MKFHTANWISTRRNVQIVLAGLWILDGFLQLQPAMFTKRFARQVIAPAGQGQPLVVSAPVETMARIIAHQPILFGASFALIQLVIGIGIVYRSTTRIALAGSILWALSVWYIGEGLGGLLGGGASLLAGAPGAALLYAVLAIAVWPGPDPSGGSKKPADWLAAAWAVLWIGGAVLQLLPGRDTDGNLSMS